MHSQSGRRDPRATGWGTNTVCWHKEHCLEKEQWLARDCCGRADPCPPSHLLLQGIAWKPGPVSVADFTSHSPFCIENEKPGSTFLDARAPNGLQGALAAGPSLVLWPGVGVWGRRPCSPAVGSELRLITLSIPMPWLLSRPRGPQLLTALSKALPCQQAGDWPQHPGGCSQSIRTCWKTPETAGHKCHHHM